MISIIYGVFGLNVRIISPTEFVEHIKFYDGAKLGRGLRKACAKKIRIIPPFE